MGITEPTATFSACFGAPFMVWHPAKYAELLADKMSKHNVNAVGLFSWAKRRFLSDFAIQVVGFGRFTRDFSLKIHGFWTFLDGFSMVFSWPFPKKLEAWLINTGWTGGAFGKGHRMSLKDTRAIIDAIHSGDLAKADYENFPRFNLQA